MTNTSMLFPTPPATAGSMAGTRTETGANTNAGSDTAPEKLSATSAARGDLMDQVVSTAHETIDRLADTAAPHVNRLTEGLSEAGEQMHDEAGKLREASAEWAETLRGIVRDNPLAALGTALAVGLLVARLTR